MDTQLDPQVVNLAKAIRQTESGGNFGAKGKSGEFGAYQFTDNTWKAQSSKYGINVPLAQATPEQQNAVAYNQIKEWKDSGKNVAQIASMWNAGQGEPDAYTGKFSNGKPSVGTNSFGVKYSVPDYAYSVASAYQQIKGGSEVGVDPNNPSSVAAVQPEQQGGPAFPSAPGDSGLTAGAKALGNLPGSAAGFAKGVAESFNPIEVLNNLGKVGSGFSELAGQEGASKAFLDVLKGIPEAAYQTLVPQGIRQAVSGDLAGAAQSFTNDPFGQAAPAVLAAVGGAKAIDRVAGTALSGAVDAGISRVGGAVADTAGTVFGKPAALVTGAASSLTRSLASHMTGLNPETISQVIADPKSFSKVAQDAISRSNIFDEVKSGLKDLQDAYGETGKLYQEIKGGTTSVAVPENFIRSVLEKNGLKLETTPENPGKLVVTADVNSITRNPADIKALQNFVDNWVHQETLTPAQYLNMRSDIQAIAKHGKEIGTNRDAAKVGKDLYAEANRAVRPQIQGLKALDETASPQIELIKKVKKDLLNADGTFKDNAPSKIVNSLNKEGLLSRLEQIKPGITKQLQILKAVEDIERASGIKVGSYTRGGLEGFGIATGNLPAIAAAIISNPTVAVYLIRGLGWSKAQIIPLLHILKTVAGDVNNSPDKLLNQ